MDFSPPLEQLREQFAAIIEPHVGPAEAAQVWEELAPAAHQMLTQLLIQATHQLDVELKPHGLRLAPEPGSASFSWSVRPAIVIDRSDTEVPSQATSSLEPTRLVGWL